MTGIFSAAGWTAFCDEANRVVRPACASSTEPGRWGWLLHLCKMEERVAGEPVAIAAEGKFPASASSGGVPSSR